jgi:hypothetical protein
MRTIARALTCLAALLSGACCSSQQAPRDPGPAAAHVGATDLASLMQLAEERRSPIRSTGGFDAGPTDVASLAELIHRLTADATLPVGDTLHVRSERYVHAFFIDAAHPDTAGIVVDLQTRRWWIWSLGGT